MNIVYYQYTDAGIDGMEGHKSLHMDVRDENSFRVESQARLLIAEVSHVLTQQGVDHDFHEMKRKCPYGSIDIHDNQVSKKVLLSALKQWVLKKGLKAVEINALDEFEAPADRNFDLQSVLESPVYEP